MSTGEALLQTQAEALRQGQCPVEVAEGVLCLESSGTPHPHDGPHQHAYGWSARTGIETFEHTHERGDERHEHVLRDGGTEVKRTWWPDDDVKCGAQDWGYDDADEPFIYGTCGMPAGHPGKRHAQATPSGSLWAEWSGPADSRAPEGARDGYLGTGPHD